MKQQATAAHAGGEAPEASKEEVVESITGLLRRRMRAKRIIAPVFRDMDIDKTGFLNYDDFDAALRRLGIEAPKEHIRWVCESIDGDGGGYIDYNDFATAVSGDAAADEDGYFSSELKLAASKLVDQPPPAAVRPRPATSPRQRMHASNLPAAEPQLSRRPSCAPRSPSPPEPTVDARMQAAVAAAAALRDAAAEARAKEREAAAIVAAAAAARAAERAERRKVQEGEHQLKKVVEQIGARVGLLGSVGALFRRTERSPAVIKVADITKAFENTAVKMTEQTRENFYRELGLEHLSELPYRDFVRTLLDVTGIDAGAAKAEPPLAIEALTGRAREAELRDAQVTAAKPRAPGESRDPRFKRMMEAVERRGQVGSVYLEANRLVPPASPRAAKGHLTTEERLAAIVGMRKLREKVVASKESFAQTPLEGGDGVERGALSYNEFGEALRFWEPRLTKREVHGFCSLIDVKGGGEVDMYEFARIIESEQADLENLAHVPFSACKLVERYEREHPTEKGTSQWPPTRYGYTPAAKMGIQARELLQGGPNSAYYVTEDERFRPTMSQTRTPEWQMAKTSLAAQRHAVRLQNIRVNQAREARVGRELDKKCDRKAELRYNAIFGQKMRYLYSIAKEERTRLK